MKARRLAWLGAFLFCFAWGEGFACTAFLMGGGDHPVMGANFDWPTGEGVIVVNRKGVHKTAMTDPAKSLNPAVWTSRYGSVTFNLYGVDWPWGGMNTAGLAGSTQQIRQARYPTPDGRPSIFLLQWLQFQLDNFATVAQVIAHVSEIRIRPLSTGKGTHYFFSDVSGDAAIVEFIDGKSRVYHEETMGVTATSNDPYATLLVYLKKFAGFGGHFAPGGTNLSRDRFVRAANGVQNYDPAAPAVDQTLALLQEVAYQSHRMVFTHWRIAFDLGAGRIYYLTRQNPDRREINLRQIDFSCGRPVQMLDVHHGGEGVVNTFFSDYSRENNRKMFERLFRKNPLNTSEYKERVDRLARYPETFFCD